MVHLRSVLLLRRDVEDATLTEVALDGAGVDVRREAVGASDLAAHVAVDIAADAVAQVHDEILAVNLHLKAIGIVLRK